MNFQDSDGKVHTEAFCDVIYEVYNSDVPTKDWWEPWSTLAVKRLVKPRMSCINVGANRGWYTLLMGLLAGRFGTVTAFEPITTVTLNRRVQAARDRWDDGLARTRVIEAALGDRTETRYVYRKAPGWSLRTEAVDSPDFAGVVSFWRLDEWWAAGASEDSRIDLLFVDIDGSEVRFLRGAKQVLSTFRPILVLEVGHQGTVLTDGTHGEAGSILASCGYTRFENAREKPLTFDKLPIKRGSGINVFCYPEGV